VAAASDAGQLMVGLGDAQHRATQPDEVVQLGEHLQGPINAQPP
jgi:hypothetical protein